MKVRMIIVFLLAFLSTYSQDIKRSNETPFMNDNPIVIHIADSVAKAELQKYNVSHPNTIMNGQLSLKYYDRTLETTLDGVYSFRVNYKFNQPIGGKVLFTDFSVFVDIDKKKMKFIRGK